MSRRELRASFVFFVVLCLLPPNDWTFLSSSKNSLSESCRTFVLADGASVVQPGETENETSVSTPSKEKSLTFGQIVTKAGKKGLGGGLPGAVAGVVQVLMMMWLRTVINYQMRYGTTFSRAINLLYREGGISRFYQGLVFALIQAPLSRFVSTAANDGVQVFLASFSATRDWGPGLTTLIGAFVVGIARLILMPIDTCKTVLQVDSKEGFKALLRRLRAGHVGVLYQGAVANAISSIMGHYPWFYTYNLLSAEKWLHKAIPSPLLKNASVGLLASVVSDSIVNVFRVVKTTKQAFGAKRNLSYSETIRMVLAADGWKGLFGRGLRTRILANAVQSVIFTIVWRGLAERWGDSRNNISVEPEEERKPENQRPHGDTQR